MNVRKKLFLFPAILTAVGGACFAIILIANASFGQQLPFENHPTDRVTLPPAGADYKNDPLFQEIEKLVLRGSGVATGNEKLGDATGAKSPDLVSSALDKESLSDSISDARWHAVETILSAARTVSKDLAVCEEQGDRVGAGKARSVVRSLRSQALELLLVR